jgi:hypothetical protein
MDWSTHLLRSFADQTATWFVGVVLALLGVFSGKLVETIKFALNRADLRTKYYEQLAVDLSAHVFAVNRLTKVYYGSAWASDEDKSAMAEQYNASMIKFCSQEYVYLSWLQHYWNKEMAQAFTRTMEKVRAVDTALMQMNEDSESQAAIEDLEKAYAELRKAVHSLLVDATH